MKLKSNKFKVLISLFNENKKINIILKLVFVLLPIVIAFLIIRRNNIFSFYPAPVLGDEMGYYRVTYSFVNGGSNFGNYGVSYNGDVAAKFGGFSAHGPKYTIFYGLFGFLFGWHPYTIFIVNIILLTISFILIAKFVKLKNIQWLLMIILMFSFFPFLYFYVSGMVETTQYIFIFIYSILLYYFFKNPNKKYYIINFVFIFFLTFFRINYAILYIPIILYYNKMKFIKNTFLQLSLSLILSIVSYLTISIFSAPYPGYISTLLNYLFDFKIGTLFITMFNHSTEIFKNYLSLSSNTIVEKVFNYLYLIILLFNCVLFIIHFKKKNKIYLYNIFILLVTLLIIIVLYEVTYYKTVRTMGVFMLLSILMLIYNNKKKYASVIIIAFIISTYFIINFNTFIINAKVNFVNEPLVSDKKTVSLLNKNMKCSNSNNRWDNTVSVPNSYSYNSNIIYGLSPCIGINYVLNEDYSKISKSKYILVSDDTTINKNIYSKIEETNLGKLYEKKGGKK